MCIEINNAQSEKCVCGPNHVVVNEGAVCNELSLCADENPNGVIVGSPCTCGSAGTATIGDHCSVDSVGFSSIITLRCQE